MEDNRTAVTLPASLHLDLSKIAAVQLTGVQDIVTYALTQYVADHQDLLQEYAKTWGKL